eukprot:TRINITY_DN15545_c0_g1_i1.p1 TRINITY_DN15545_c0_g1~~TRINITY_DN15545_c0_g1_i1.p1  ORF type:complete len:143 (-),score=24.16 TRINITY_DN15545_c0_g1_i1:101-529(-)
MKSATKRCSTSKLAQSSKKKVGKKHTMSSLIDSARVDTGSFITASTKKGRVTQKSHRLNSKKSTSKQSSVASTTRQKSAEANAVVRKKPSAQQRQLRSSRKILKENNKLLEKRKNLPDITDRNSVKEILRISRRILNESKIR